MSQVQVSKLVSKLRYNLKDRRKLKNIEGPQGRHDKIRKVVTALFKYERIELKYELADESRGYAERVIVCFFNNYVPRINEISFFYILNSMH